MKSIEDKIKVYSSFVSNLKCFNFIFNITYPPYDPIRFHKFFFAKITFEEEAYSTDCDCFKFYIAFFKKDKTSFQKLENFYLKKNNLTKTKNALLFEPVRVDYEYQDKFNWFKNPLSLFRVDKFVCFLFFNFNLFKFKVTNLLFFDFL